MKVALEDDLRPADPIERLWVDEFVDLEWDLHRLRSVRRTVVENALTDRLAEKAMRGAGALGSPETWEQFTAAARACVRGVAAGREVMVATIGHFRIADELRVAQAQSVETLARLEQSIHATSRLRDAVLARLYGRRDSIADGRIQSARGR